ncbi:MAG: nitrilase-related carbon-nitrogen hydrolase, partial [Planctomycetaceae bacterium]|nr:nitrilase-related carbon-nitrogen hydrolase [Planctomycetaceae bacterium]
MKVALAQLNPTVGDVVGNAALVREAVREAHGAGAELVVCSELVLSGYPPKDLLLRDGFAAACDRAVDRLAAECPPDTGVLVGHPSVRGLPADRVANACSLLVDGRVQSTIHKLLLPNYDVFDERRYFRPADDLRLIDFRGRKLGVHICEDAWWGEPDTFYHVDPPTLTDPVGRLAELGAELFINVSASPFEAGKPEHRVRLLQR